MQGAEGSDTISSVKHCFGSAHTMYLFRNKIAGLINLSSLRFPEDCEIRGFHK